MRPAIYIYIAKYHIRSLFNNKKNPNLYFDLTGIQNLVIKLLSFPHCADYFARAEIFVSFSNLRIVTRSHKYF